MFRREFFKRLAAGIVACVAAPLIPAAKKSEIVFPGVYGSFSKVYRSPWIIVEWLQETPVLLKDFTAVQHFRIMLRYRGGPKMDLSKIDHPFWDILKANRPYYRYQIATDPFEKTLIADFWKKI